MATERISYDLFAIALVDHEYTEMGRVGASERLAAGPREKSQEAYLARDDPSVIVQPSSNPKDTAVASGVM